MIVTQTVEPPLRSQSSAPPPSRSQSGVAAKMFETLSNEGINIKVIATSEIKISVLIDRKYMELAVQSLHDAFELEKTT